MNIINLNKWEFNVFPIKMDEDKEEYKIWMYYRLNLTLKLYGSILNKKIMKFKFT